MVLDTTHIKKRRHISQVERTMAIIKNMKNINKLDLILEKIDDLVQDFKEFKLAAIGEDGLKVGDRVEITNPSKGQNRFGNITKIHQNGKNRDRATVATKDDKGKIVKTWRLFKNLRKIDDDGYGNNIEIQPNSTDDDIITCVSGKENTARILRTIAKVEDDDDLSDDDFSY